TLTLNADGSFDYEHDGSETTVDSFTYKVNDGTVDGNTVTVTLNITPQNDIPVAADDAATVDEGATVSIDVVANDSDADGSLNLGTITIVSSPSNGSLVDNGDGTISYTHDDSETTNDSFTYTINDNEGATSNVATVTITINPVDDTANETPVAMDDAATVDEGATVSIDVVANDSDADGSLNLGTITIVSSPSKGTLVDNGDGTISYTHDDSETTSDSFTYTINDNEGATSNVATVTITVNPVDDTVNEVPVAMDDAATVDEGATVSIDVVANDSDVDGSLNLGTITIVSSLSNGSLVDNGDGTISYTHDDSETTNDSFTYTINDNEGATSNVATVTITINPVDDTANETPVAMDDAATVDEGATVSIDVVANDSDADGSLNLGTITIVSSSSNGSLVDNGDGTISYTHDDSETTSDSFTYTIDDNEGATSNVATVTITVNPVDDTANEAPVANDDSAEIDQGLSVVINVVANDLDSDGTLDLGSIVIVSSPSNGTLMDNVDGSITYQHDNSETISDSFTYTIDDDEGATSNVATVTITVNPNNTMSNESPLAENDFAELDEGTSVIINVSINDSDSDGTLDLNSIRVDSNPVNGTLVVNGDGTISYNHDGSKTTNDSFTYTINDNEGVTSNVAMVTINIIPVIEVPDAFTPNNDGVNDGWIIPNIEEFPDNVVKIFNRWGNEIITIRQYNNTTNVWESQSNGRLQVGSDRVPDGTYFYLIQLEEGRKPLSGFVIVNR
ncbi:gliding motility-associated C-terminal domain-containing protein, partial [Ekhidna lutea]